MLTCLVIEVPLMIVGKFDYERIPNKAMTSLFHYGFMQNKDAETQVLFGLQQLILIGQSATRLSVDTKMLMWCQ